RPVSITMVTPRSRGRGKRRSMAASRPKTPSHGRSLHMADDLLQSLRDRGQVRSPGDDHHLAVFFDTKLEQAALEHGEVVALPRYGARAHFDARRFVAVVMPMKLQTALAADQHPLLANGRPFVEEVDRG